MQTQSPQSTQPQAQTSQQQPTSQLEEGRGYIPVQDEGTPGTNRTTYVINDDGEDPLDLSPKKEVQRDIPSQNEVVAPEETKPEEEQVQDVSEEETIQESPQYSKEFNNDLEKVLEARTGVGLDGIVEAVTTLLSWYNDTLKLQIEQEQQPTPQAAPKAPPTFSRSQGRNPSPAANAYDFRLSEIQAMDAQTYAQNAQKITNAFLNKRVLMD